MDNKQLAALVRKNMKKAGTGGPSTFGKKYDQTKADEPTDEATLKERDRENRFFKEMKKREF